jgi:hypothetical protein
LSGDASVLAFLWGNMLYCECDRLVACREPRGRFGRKLSHGPLRIRDSALYYRALRGTPHK